MHKKTQNRPLLTSDDEPSRFMRIVSLNCVPDLNTCHFPNEPIVQYFMQYLP